MKNKAWLFLKKNRLIIILSLIILFGAFLRLYHFSDWLHFELDQSRDAKIIDLALEEGIGNLPLLGPKAAGSFLRLGPIFYYFKYLSGVIFGNTPSGIAVIIMLFGILAMPAFYFFIRRYFNKKISLALLLLFATSLFLIMYSRFSWNPNALPFFSIAAFYCLLRLTDKEEKNNGWWLGGAAFFLAIAMQLHFLAFVSLPVVFGSFLLIKRPRIKLKFWLGAIAIMLLLNLPVFLNEIKTGGKNFSEFKKVALGKTNKDSERGLVAKLVRDFNENSANYFLILSAQNTEFAKLEQNIRMGIGCDQKCKENIPLEVLAGIIFSLGLLLMLKNLFSEKEARKKDFLLLSTLWLLVSFVLFIPLALDISPRFWLIISALPFVFLGFILDYARKIFSKKVAMFLIITAVGAFFISNSYKIYERFKGLKEAPYKTVEVSADRILRERNRVTLEQQYLVIDYVESFYRSNSFPVYLNSEPFYRRSLMFHLDQRNIPRDDFRNATNDGKVYQNGNYFLVYPTNANLDKELNDYLGIYTIINRKPFGTLTVLQLLPEPEAINALEQDIPPRGNTNTNSAGVPERYTWEEIFSEEE